MIKEQENYYIPDHLFRSNIPIGVAVYPYGLRNCDELLLEVHSWDKPPRDWSAACVYLGKKDDYPNQNPHRLTFLGGLISDQNHLPKAAIEAVQRDARLTVCPFTLGSIAQNRRVPDISRSFVYYIGADTSHVTSRRVYPLTLEVIDPSKMQAVYPHKSTSKIDRLIGIDYHKFKNAVTDGYYTDPTGQIHNLIGASILGRSNEDTYFKISMEQSKNKDFLINEILSDLDYYDRSIQNHFQSKLVIALIEELERSYVSVRARLAGRSLGESLHYLLAQPTIAPKFDSIFKKMYDQLIIEGYTSAFRELDRHIKTPAKPIEKKLALTSRIKNRVKKIGKGDRQFDHQEGMIKKRLKFLNQRIQEGSFGLDLLSSLAVISHFPNALSGKSTRTIVTAFRLITDLTDFGLNKVNFDTQISSYDKKIDHLKKYLPELSIPEEIDFFDRLDSEIINVLSRSTNLSIDDIRLCWNRATEMIPAQINELQQFEPTKQFRLMHQLPNEVTNAGLARTLLLAQEVDVKDNFDQWPIIKNASWEQLTFFLKYLFIHESRSTKENQWNHPVQTALNRYFGRIITKSHHDFMHPLADISLPKLTYYRLGKPEIPLIIDEKANPKSVHSEIRVSFQKSIKKIIDHYSCNVVIPTIFPIDGELTLFDLTPQQRVNLIDKILDGFLVYLETEMAQKGETLKVEFDDNTMENYFRHIKGWPLKGIGDRGGSKGHRIIRRKLALSIGDYSYELAGYPFETFESDPSVSSKTLMGFKEKIEDDAAYAWRRLLDDQRLVVADKQNPGNEIVGLPSYYECLFPPPLYPRRNQRMRSDWQI